MHPGSHLSLGQDKYLQGCENWCASCQCRISVIHPFYAPRPLAKSKGCLRAWWPRTHTYPWDAASLLHTWQKGRWWSCTWKGFHQSVGFVAACPQCHISSQDSSHLWRTSFTLVLLSLSSFTSPRWKVGSTLSLSSKPSGLFSRTEADSRAQSVIPFDRVMAFLPPFLTSTRKFLCSLPLASGSTRDGSTSNLDFLSLVKQIQSNPISLEVRPYFQSASVRTETTTIFPGASCILELVTKCAKVLGLCDAAWKLLKAICHAGWTCMFIQNCCPVFLLPKSKHCRMTLVPMMKGTWALYWVFTTTRTGTLCVYSRPAMPSLSSISNSTNPRYLTFCPFAPSTLSNAFKGCKGTPTNLLFQDDSDIVVTMHPVSTRAWHATPFTFNGATLAGPTTQSRSWPSGFRTFSPERSVLLPLLLTLWQRELCISRCSCWQHNPTTLSDMVQTTTSETTLSQVVFLMLKCIYVQMNSDTFILVYFNLVGAGHLHTCHDWIWTLRQAGCLCCQMVGKINNLTGNGVQVVMRVAS